MRHLKFLICIVSLPLIASAQTRYTGEINGADYIVDVPVHSTGDVLFIARGFRPDFFPVSAVYEVGTNFYQTLLSEGWTIASTAFKTNDWVVGEGGEDILALQRHIEVEIHPVKRSIIYGETMGGGVAVWLAENKPQSFSGVLCLGAHLFPEPEKEGEPSEVIAPVFNQQPKLPIIFLANDYEMKSSQSYVSEVEDARYLPITWYIDRTGHVNVNSAERLAAFRALTAWIAGTPAQKVEDGTLEMSPESAAAHQGQMAAANIRLLRPLYGNIYTTFVEGDLDALGVEISDAFKVTHKQQTHSITYAKAYSDVPYGEWVAFIDSEGYVQISRNYANAAETIGAEVGDPLLFTNFK